MNGGESDEQACATPGSVVLVDVRDAPLSIDEVSAAVKDARAGALALFVGHVRDHDHGAGVASLDYSSHPSAVERAQRVAAAIAQRPGVVKVAVVHRIGHLEIGDTAIVAAVSAEHRAQAFDGCRELVDEVKHTVPIWKHQQFTDGTDEWVGLP